MRKWKCWCCAHTNTLQHYSLVQYLYISACCVETIIIILLFSMYIATCTYVYFYTPCEECSSFCERQSLAQYTYRECGQIERWDERGRTFYNFFGLHGRVKHNYLRCIGWKYNVGSFTSEGVRFTGSGEGVRFTGGGEGVCSSDVMFGEMWGVTGGEGDNVGVCGVEWWNHPRTAVSTPPKVVVILDHSLRPSQGRKHYSNT